MSIVNYLTGNIPYDTLSIMQNIEKIVDRRPKYIPIEKMIDYADQGLTNTEIGKLVGCSQQAIAQRFQRIGYSTDRMIAFKRNRADMFAYYQSEILNSITPQAVKKAPLQVKLMAFGILYDKERLERGQSTENVSIAGTLSTIDSRIQELRKRLPSK